MVTYGVILERLLDLADGLLISQLAVHEGAATRLLHHLGPIEAGDLAEGLAAVHDGEVDDLGVGQQQAAIGCSCVMGVDE